jgi:gamma-glutamylaminecyclotransferase
MTAVFIYGTLKRGFPFHQMGLRDARFVGPARTVLPYPLLIAADFFGPMMLDRPGEGKQVLGELFEVAPEQLPRLDELENVGQPGSFRGTLLVEPPGGGVQQNAIGFMKNEAWLHPLHSGYLCDYQDRRFIPPWQR